MSRGNVINQSSFLSYNWQDVLNQPCTSLLGPIPSPEIVGHQLAQPNSMPTPHLGMNLPPSGVMAPPPQPVASEWPQQKPRTGPPPGTKITETAPVRVLSGTFSSRSSSDTFNFSGHFQIVVPFANFMSICFRLFSLQNREKKIHGEILGYASSMS